MKQLYFCLLVLALFAMSTTHVNAQQQAIDTFIRNQMANYHIPAVSFAVIDNGRVVAQGAYGLSNVEYKIPNTRSTAFQLASATKLIAATAIMTLVEEKKLDLAKPVSAYLPQVPQSWSDVRVMDLLAHQSGVVDLLGLQYNFKSAAQAFDTAVARPLDFSPGTKTVYAGGDYAVVMMLIEKITGMPFQEFLQKNLLQKLAMNHTVYNNMEQDFIYRTYDTIPYAATVYAWDSKKSRQRIFSMMFPSWSYPAGGLFSSIDDLAKWAVALDKNTVLSPATEDQMWEPAKLRNGQTAPFGVGWIVDKHNGEKATGHSGGPALADIVRIPGRKLTVIVLTNQLELRPFLTMRVLDLYLKTRNETKN